MIKNAIPLARSGGSCLYSTLGRMGQENQEFEGNLGYIVSFRPVWVRKWDSVPRLPYGIYSLVGEKHNKISSMVCVTGNIKQGREGKVDVALSRFVMS
jgi:hypothetical protein